MPGDILVIDKIITYDRAVGQGLALQPKQVEGLAEKAVPNSEPYW